VFSHPGKFVPEGYDLGVRVRATQHRDNANFIKGKLSWIVCLWKVVRMWLACSRRDGENWMRPADELIFYPAILIDGPQGDLRSQTLSER
jgi:hypothetical protein